MKTHFPLSSDELKFQIGRETVQNSEPEDGKGENAFFLISDSAKSISVLKSEVAALKTPLKEYPDDISTSKLLLNSLQSQLEKLDSKLSRCFPHVNSSYILSEELSNKIFHAKRAARNKSQQQLLFQVQAKSDIDGLLSPKENKNLTHKRIEGVKRSDITWTDEETKNFIKVLQSLPRSKSKEALLEYMSKKMSELSGKRYTEDQIQEKLEQDYLKIKEKNLQKKEKYGKFIQLSLV